MQRAKVMFTSALNVHQGQLFAASETSRFSRLSDFFSRFRNGISDGFRNLIQFLEASTAIKICVGVPEKSTMSFAVHIFSRMEKKKN
jgi:hypothetical protein